MMKKKTVRLSLLAAMVALIMILVPTTAFADEVGVSSQGQEKYKQVEGTAYISISDDAKYVVSDGLIPGVPMAYVPIDLAEVSGIDLDERGLGDFNYDADGDGVYETTVLQLLIYVMENYEYSEGENFAIDGSPGSSYITKFWGGHDSNFLYYYNGEYPTKEDQPDIGSTSDEIVLKDQDFVNVAMYSDWAFWSDPAAGFHFFYDSDDKAIHNLTATVGDSLAVKLGKIGEMEAGVPSSASDYSLYWGSAYDPAADNASALGTVKTNESGEATITFTEPGIYCLWADGGLGSTDTVVSSPAFAYVTVTAPGSWERLFGHDALDTMCSIVGSAPGFSERGGTVVIATESGYWDALTASGLAGIGGAPVLMTSKEGLSFQTAFELGRLAPSRVLVCGGVGAVSNKVTDSIESLTGVTPERFFGNTAADTAREVYQQNEGWGETAIIATVKGFQDALSIAPYAYAAKCPIFLTEADGTLSNDTLAAIEDGKIKEVYIAGGTSVVAKSVESQLGTLFKERLAGNSAIDTSAEVAKWELSQGMTVEGMGVATAAGYQDALSGAAVCGKNNAVLVLVSDTDYTAIDATVKAHALEVKKGYVFGGTSVVSQATYDYLQELVTPYGEAN